MLKKSIHIVLTTTLLMGLSACGGGSTNDNQDNNKPKGYFIDSPVQGLNYICGNDTGITDSSGTFFCENAPVTFKLGEMTLGTLNTFTNNAKVYPQDLIGISRDNFSDEKLIKLIRLLQSLDDDGEISKSINIPKDISDYYSSELTFDNVMLEILAAPANGDLVSEEDAIAHLQDSMGSDAHPQEGDNNDTDETDNTSETILDDVLDNTLDANESDTDVEDMEENNSSIPDIKDFL